MKAWQVVVIALLVTVVDQVSKYLVRTFFSFTVNSGVAFGLFLGYNTVFLFLTLAVMVVFMAVIFRKPFYEFGLLVGGAAGNGIDRVVFGGVIDFIDVGWWPSFNVADSCMTIGVVLLMIRLWKH